VLAQGLVFALYFSLKSTPHEISYLWYNLIGSAACVLFSLAIQAVEVIKEEARPAL
jgi:hypothetical protein